MFAPQRGAHRAHEMRQQPRGHALDGDDKRAEREGDAAGEGARHDQGRRTQQKVSQSATNV